MRTDQFSCVTDREGLTKKYLLWDGTTYLEVRLHSTDRSSERFLAQGSSLKPPTNQLAFLSFPSPH